MIDRLSPSFDNANLGGLDGFIARKMAKEITLAESEGRLPFEGEKLENVTTRLKEQYSWMNKPFLTPEDRVLLDRMPELLAGVL